MAAPPSPPYRDRLEELAPDPNTGRSKPTGFFSRGWIQWFTEILAYLSLSPHLIGFVRLNAQAAAIAPHNAAVGTAGSQTYEVHVYARIAVAASINSTLTVTIRWTDGTVGQSRVSPNINGNTTATIHVDSFPIHTDAASPITYETTYVTAGATPMQYELTVIVKESPLL